MLTGQKYQRCWPSKGYIAELHQLHPAEGRRRETSAVLMKAASTGRFVPNSKNWTKVEDGNVLQNMFDEILTGSRSHRRGHRKEASDKITELLNS